MRIADAFWIDERGVQHCWNRLPLWFWDWRLKLLAYDDESDMITFELVDAPGSRISYSCKHWQKYEPR
jgi:hypothetical protein